MANSIPRAARRRWAEYLKNLNLKVAFFVAGGWTYDELTATTYTALAGGSTEVSSAGTGYTTGGYTLTSKSSADLAGNGAIMIVSDATTVASATFDCRYAVIYRSGGTPGVDDYIEGVIDFGSTKSVTNGTITVTWDVTNGLFSIQ
jgi:hypothetical protein